VKVTLPNALEEFVEIQVKSGEFKDASAVMTEAVRIFRDARESVAMNEMRDAFAGTDRVGGKNEPTSKERALIDEAIKNHRAGTFSRASRLLSIASIAFR
jgi:putative addiction module CopG family antidote